MFDFKNLIKDLRYCSQYANCKGCSRSDSYEQCEALKADAAAGIEELLNKLCDWCGACLGERNPFDCEIIGTAFAVPPDPDERSLN